MPSCSTPRGEEKVKVLLESSVWLEGDLLIMDFSLAMEQVRVRERQAHHRLSLAMEQVRVGGRLVQSWISARAWSRLGLGGGGLAHKGLQLWHGAGEAWKGTSLSCSSAWSWGRWGLKGDLLNHGHQLDNGSGDTGEGHVHDVFS
jgi:hypothetical protein